MSKKRKPKTFTGDMNEIGDFNFRIRECGKGGGSVSLTFYNMQGKYAQQHAAMLAPDCTFDVRRI